MAEEIDRITGRCRTRRLESHQADGLAAILWTIAAESGDIIYVEPKGGACYLFVT